jgi:hypothetical protein
MSNQQFFEGIGIGEGGLGVGSDYQKLLDETSKCHNDTWWMLRQIESVLVAAKQLPCLHANDEESMESLQYVDPILHICLGHVEKVISQHEKVESGLTRLSNVEMSETDMEVNKVALERFKDGFYPKK